MRMRKREMPKIDLTKIKSEEAREYARRVINSRTGRLRATKPRMKYELIDGKYGWKIRRYDMLDACAAYVWRMLCFYASPKQAMEDVVLLRIPQASPSVYAGSGRC